MNLSLRFRRPQYECNTERLNIQSMHCLQKPVGHQLAEAHFMTLYILIYKSTLHLITLQMPMDLVFVLNWVNSVIRCMLYILGTSVCITHSHGKGLLIIMKKIPVNLHYGGLEHSNWLLIFSNQSECSKPAQQNFTWEFFSSFGPSYACSTL